MNGVSQVWAASRMYNKAELVWNITLLVSAELVNLELVYKLTSLIFVAKKLVIQSRGRTIPHTILSPGPH